MSIETQAARNENKVADTPQPISSYSTLHLDEASALESFWACYEKKSNFGFEKKNHFFKRYSLDLLTN